MPVRLRYTVMYAAGLQAFGPNHSFTKSIERILRAGTSSGADQDNPMDNLSDAERSELLERYERIMRSLPVDRLAA